jgi:hypothetical protein
MTCTDAIAPKMRIMSPNATKDQPTISAAGWDVDCFEAFCKEKWSAVRGNEMPFLKD